MLGHARLPLSAFIACACVLRRCCSTMPRQRKEHVRACSKASDRVRCFAEAVAARRKARNTEQKQANYPTSICNTADAAFATATLGARQPMTMLFVAPLAKTDSLGCGVRRDPGHMLHLRTHGRLRTGSYSKGENRRAMASSKVPYHGCLSCAASVTWRALRKSSVNICAIFCVRS